MGGGRVGECFQMGGGGEKVFPNGGGGVRMCFQRGGGVNHLFTSVGNIYVVVVCDMNFCVCFYEELAFCCMLVCCCGGCVVCWFVIVVVVLYTGLLL